MMKMLITASSAALMLGAGFSASCSQGDTTADNSSQAAQERSADFEVAQNDSSAMVGANVYDSNDQQVGTIQEVTVAEDGTEQAIIAVGEYLAIGAQELAVPASALSLKSDGSGYSLSMTAEDLESSAASPETPEPQEDY